MIKDSSYIEELKPHRTHHLCNSEFGPINSEEKRIKVFKTILSLTSHQGILISKEEDIPKYEKNRLDEDLRYAIRDLYSFNTTKNHMDYLIYVFYTYESLGGVVKRYRITFYENKVDHVNVTRIADGIGNPWYSM